MTNCSNFGKEVKKKLIDRGWTLSELAETVSAKTELFCDAAYISRIFTGKRNAPKIKAAICEILEIKEE